MASSRLSNALSGLKGLDVPGNPSAPPATPSSQQAASFLTPEQEGALAARSDILQVKAYAGCGKTTLLREFARQGPHGRTLYLAFNKPIAISAQADFGHTALCQTSHSLALRSLMRSRSSWRGVALESKIGNPSPSRLSEALPGAFTPGEISAGAPRICLEAIRSFIASADPEISSAHLFQSTPLAKAAATRLSLDPQRLLAAAKLAWEIMSDPSNLALPLSHDGYLKVWSLSEIPIEAELILIDEAQDSNAALLSALRGQPARQIYVGDEHQAIYGFRGALNAFSRLQGAETHYLTRSFRLRSRLARLASGALLLKKAPKPLIGEKDGGLIETKIPLGAKSLFLARSNPGLFERALSLAKAGKKMHFLGSDTSRFAIDGLDDLLILRSGKKPQDPFMASFADLSALRDAAEEIFDSSLLLKIRLVEEYGQKLPEAMRSISRSTESDPGKASVTLSTVHKAKGLESDWCELADDFELSAFQRDRLEYWDEKETEEANIFYVAITRAKEGLALSHRQMVWARRIEKLFSDPAKAAVPSAMRSQTEAFLLQAIAPAVVSGGKTGRRSL